MLEKKVLVLLHQGFELIEISGFTDVLAWASFDQQISITTQCVSTRPTITSAFGGITLNNLATLNNIDLTDFDALAIPGGMQWAGFFDDAYSPPVSECIAHFHQRKKPIAAVCVASLALAHAGVLGNRQATVFHSASGQHAKTLQDKGAVFVDAPVVIDEHIITSTGPGTSVEVALALLNMLAGPDIVHSTRAMMRVSAPRDSWFAPQVAT